MDKTVLIKIIRKSDGSEFTIGTGSDWRLAKKGLDGFGGFDNDLNFVDNGIHDGGLIASSRLSKVDRTIKCGYMLMGQNDVERRRVTSFFNAKDVFRVFISYMGRTLWAEANIYKFDISMSADVRALMMMTIVFTFPNPYLKSFDDFGADIASKTAMIAFPYLCSMDRGPRGITGGTFNFAQQVLITNDGDVETYCRAVFRANDVVRNPSLEINGQYVRVIDSMIAGDIIEMDFTALPPTVKKNGQNYIGHCDRTSAFTGMNIPVGDVGVRYTADDGGDNLAVSIYYNKLYTSI